VIRARFARTAKAVLPVALPPVPRKGAALDLPKGLVPLESHASLIALRAFHFFFLDVTIQSPLKVTIILLFFRDFMQNIDL
jgi:hypothetical protein